MSRSLTPNENIPRNQLYEYGKGGIWAGRFDEERNLLLLPKFEPRFLVYPTRSLVTVTSELSWLSITLNVWY